MSLNLNTFAQVRAVASEIAVPSIVPLSDLVIGAEMVILGSLEVYDAIVAPVGMPSPLTVTPLARLVFVPARLIEVVEGSNERAVYAKVCVIGAESTIEGPPALYEVTVTPDGIPVPLT